jgi:hypothetical protein
MTATIILDFDNLKILSATADTAILLCHRTTTTDEEFGEQTPCVVVLSREMFSDTLASWLDAKASYLETFNHFAGVGYVALEYATKDDVGTTISKRLVVPEYEGEDMVPIDIYGEVKSFTVDMEHG